MNPLCRLLLDGFDKILAEMEEAMKGAEGAFGHKAKLPIIGNGISKVLGAESQFIDSFRHKVLRTCCAIAYFAGADFGAFQGRDY